MKKFVSMAMVAAMTTSMVPATAFAGAGDANATAKIVDAWTMTKDFTGAVVGDSKSVPELQIKVTDTNYKQTLGSAEDYVAEITVSLDNAVLDSSFSTANIGVRLGTEAKEEMNAELTGSSAAVAAATTKITKIENELYGEGFDIEGGDVTTIESGEEEPKTLYGKLNKANAALAAAVAGVADPTDEQINAVQAVKDAKAARATAAQELADAQEAATAAEEAYTVAQATADAATAAKAAKDAEIAAAEADLKAGDGSTTYDKYVAAKEAYEADPTDEDLKGDLDEAAADVAAVQADLAEMKEELPKLEAEVNKATAAAATAKADAETTAADVVTKENAEKAAKKAVDAAKIEAKAELKAEAGGEATKAAKAAVDAAQDAVDAKLDELKDAEAALKAALDAVDSKNEAIASTEFVIEPVEGFGKGKAAVKDADEFTFKVKGKLHKGDVIYVDLNTVMDKTSIGRQATLDVESDDLNLEAADLVYVAVEDYGLTATTKKIGNVAEEEYNTLEKDLKIESNVGDFVTGQQFELKLSNGFEFTKNLKDGANYTFGTPDGDEVIVTYTGAGADEFTIDAKNMEIEATSAKSGKVATLTIKALKGATGTFKATTKVEIMKVVDYTVVMSVDADEDVPVIYSGVDTNNFGITDDSDHLSLEVTVEETFPGAWSMRKGFNFELPDGVYVTDLEVKEADNFKQTENGTVKNVGTHDWYVAFEEAYREADHKGFEFKKRVFDDVNKQLEADPASVTFQMELVADPGFVGDVNLKFKGDLVDEQEVVIAKFATPYYAKAEQNDMKIDYRYTEVPTSIVITEAEPGLWDKDEASFELIMEHGKDENFLAFEDADVKVDEESGMEIASKVNDGSIEVELKDDSDDTAATITVSGIEMFMSRSIPAGPYDLEAITSMGVAYMDEVLFAPDAYANKDHDGLPLGEYIYGWDHDVDNCDKEYYVGCVADFSTTVREGFINVVTAGREQDDASFTTKVVVPVGESYIVAGENQISLDVPAYVSAAGYTMLPVRAVATALGINNNNVIWNGESKTVTILYGQRIITMVAGQKTVNVNGSVIPASAAVEIVDGRTFLPMRDLATALGVTDITWDAATKTATLNGGVVAE